jgi:cysteine desulfurase
MKRIYLDYASTTPVDPVVVETIRPFFTEQFGNPSSPHFFGQQARKAIEEAWLKVLQPIPMRSFSLPAAPSLTIWRSWGWPRH